MDPKTLRADTPGAQDVIHLGNAGSSLQPRAVLDRVARWSEKESRLGGYEAFSASAEEVAAARGSLGAVIATTGDHVAFAESGTVAWWRALGALQLKSGDVVLATQSEYLGMVLPLLQRGMDVRVVPDGPCGSLDLALTADALRDHPRAILIVHAASHVGVVNDVAAVGELVRAISPDTWFVVDGCQSVGQLEVDAPAIGCDFLVGTGRKWLRGPRGTAFLYAGERALAAQPDPLDSNTGFLDDHGAVVAAWGIGRYEPWELSWSAAMGLGAAADYLVQLGPAAVHSRIADLADHARAGLGALADVQLHDRGSSPGGIVSFSHDRVPAADIAAAARRQGVNVGLVTPAVAPFDHSNRPLSAMIRISPHVYNDVTDVDHMVAIVSGL